MGVDIGEIVSTGFRRTFKRNSLILVGLMLILSLLNVVASQSLFSQLPFMQGVSTVQMTQAYPLAIGMPLPVAGFLQIFLAIASTVLAIGTVRTLVSSETKKLKKSNFTENILMPFLNLIIGGIVYGLIMAAAFAVPVIPGAALMLAGATTIGIVLIALGLIASAAITFYLVTALFYWNFFVIIEDQNFVNGLQSSWNATEGKRINLFVAGFLVVLISFIAGFLFGLPAGVISVVTGTQAIASVINLVPSAFTSIFTIAAAAEAYRQITE